MRRDWEPSQRIHQRPDRQPPGGGGPCGWSTLWTGETTSRCWSPGSASRPSTRSPTALTDNKRFASRNSKDPSLLQCMAPARPADTATTAPRPERRTSSGGDPANRERAPAVLVPAALVVVRAALVHELAVAVRTGVADPDRVGPPDRCSPAAAPSPARHRRALKKPVLGPGWQRDRAVCSGEYPGCGVAGYLAEPVSGRRDRWIWLPLGVLGPPPVTAGCLGRIRW